MKPPLKALAWAGTVGVLLYAGWRTQGWAGIALVASTGLFLGLLQFHRAMSVLRRAARSPVGWIDSGVMLNARLSAGLPVAQLLRLTGSLGQRLDDGGDPGVERFAWRDNGGIEVQVRLRDGRVLDWTMSRPPEAADAPGNPAAPSPG